MNKTGTLKFEDVLCMDTPYPVSFVIDWTIPHYEVNGINLAGQILDKTLAAFDYSDG